MRARPDLADHQSVLKSQKDQLDKLLGENLQLQSDNARYGQEIAAVKRDIERLQEQNKAIKTESKSKSSGLREENKRLKGELEKLQESAKTSTQRAQEDEITARKYVEELQAARKQHDDLHVRFQQVEKANKDNLLLAEQLKTDHEKQRQNMESELERHVKWQTEKSALLDQIKSLKQEEKKKSEQQNLERSLREQHDVENKSIADAHHNESKRIADGFQTQLNKLEEDNDKLHAEIARQFASLQSMGDAKSDLVIQASVLRTQNDELKSQLDQARFQLEQAIQQRNSFVEDDALRRRRRNSVAKSATEPTSTDIEQRELHDDQRDQPDAGRNQTLRSRLAYFAAHALDTGGGLLLFSKPQQLVRRASDTFRQQHFSSQLLVVMCTSLLSTMLGLVIYLQRAILENNCREYRSFV